MNETIPPIPGESSQPKTPALAVWSLVLGILGVVLMMVCLGPLFAIPGVICGHVAYSRIKRSNGLLAGQGLALAGLITGYATIGISLLLIPLMAAIAVPNFVRARDTAMTNACINNLRMIEAAKQEWALENSKQASDTPTQAEVAHFLKNSQFPVCPADGTYTIGAVSNAPTCSIPAHKLPD